MKLAVWKIKNIIKLLEANLIKRIHQFKKYLKTQIDQYVDSNKKLPRVLVISHKDFLWYLTSRMIENERFGIWLKEGEIESFLLERKN